MKRALVVLLALVIIGSAYTPHSFRYYSTAGILWDDYDWFINDPARIPLIEGYQLYTNLANLVSSYENPLSDSIGFQGPGFFLIGGKAFGPPLGVAGVFDTRMMRIADSTGIGGLMGYGSTIDTSNVVDPNDGSILGSTITTQVVEAWHQDNDFDGFFGLGYELNEGLNLGFGFDHTSDKLTQRIVDDNEIISSYTYTGSSLDSFDSTYTYGEQVSQEMSNRVKLGAWTEMDYLELSGYLGAEMFSGDAGRDTVFVYDLNETYGDPAVTDVGWVNDVENWRYSGLAFPIELLGIYELDEGADLWFLGGFEYNMWNWKDGAGVNFVLNDTALTTTGGATATVIGKDSVLTAGSGKGSGMAYHLGTKGVFDLNEKVSFGLGLIFRGSNDADSTLNESTVYYYDEEDNGDGTPGPEDFWQTEEYDSTTYTVNKISRMGFHVPVGVEFKPVEPLALRLGATYTLRIDNSSTFTEGIGTMSRHIHREQQDGIVIDSTSYNDYGIGYTEGIQKETSSNVIYDFGIGIKVTDNFQIDLMGFTDLLDLGSWRLSAIFKF